MKIPGRPRGDFVLWSAIVVGIGLRLIPALRSDFPLHDGGMFLSMIRDLRANHFLLPAFTSYNLSDIPFAYPPFGMYAAAFLSGVFGISEVDLLRWLPAIVSAVIVPVFYWLSVRVFGNGIKSWTATVLAAFLPNSFDWLVMGGGLTRSFGILFFLIGVGHVISLFRDSHGRSLWLAVLFCSLAVLGHPEVGLQTAGICFLLWLVFGRNREGVKHALVVSVGTLSLTAPWWAAVLARHGFAPFQSAMQTGIHERLIASLFHSFFSMQGGLPILPILTLLGLFATVRKRDFLLAGWLFLPFILDPRNAPAVATYAFILLSSEGLYFLYERFIEAYNNSMGSNQSKALLFAKSLFAVLAIFLLYVSYTSAVRFSNVHLKKADRETMTWIKEHTPAEARFLLLTNDGQVSPMADAYQEWFPALAERQSLNTLQGKEWTLGSEFYEYSLALMDLQACGDSTCLEKWMMERNIRTDYLLVRPNHIPPKLFESIKQDEAYQPVYDSDVAILYLKK